MNNNKIIKTGIILMLIAVVLGAFLSHYFQELLSEKQIRSFETGIRYQLFHGLTIIILAFNRKKINSFNQISYLFIAGICFFSFSIYLLSFKDFMLFPIEKIWFITPLGGLLLIIAWFKLFFSIK